MRFIIMLIFSGLLVLAGCATQSQPMGWSIPGDKAVHFEKDSRECNYDAQKVFLSDINSPMRARFLGEETYAACMRSRGYQQR